MTLNLTLLHPNYVLQVSDRRITKEASGEIHQFTNKNVVYLARDGLFSICYSGPAYLEHVPTDTWIACKLAGEATDPYMGGKSPGIAPRGWPKTPWLDIGQSVELLRRECETLFSTLRPSQLKRLQILAAGWQKYSRGKRPTLWLIENAWSRRERRSFTTDTGPPRYWHYKKSPIGTRLYYVEQIPESRGWLSVPEMRRLIDLLRVEAISPEASLRRLVWAVRYVSNKRAPVGPDCMCIFLPNPDVQPEVVVRYVPVAQERVIITGGQHVAELPAAYTPWFVGPKIHAPPAHIVGGHAPFTLDGIRLVWQAPPVPGEQGIRFAFSTQRRPRDPSLGPN